MRILKTMNNTTNPESTFAAASRSGAAHRGASAARSDYEMGVISWYGCCEERAYGEVFVDDFCLGYAGAAAAILAQINAQS